MNDTNSRSLAARISFCFAPAFALLVTWVMVQPCSAQPQQKSAKDKLTRSTQRASNQQKYELRYRMKAGESLRWNVEQIVKTDTTVAGYNQKASIRSRSVIRWDVLDVQNNGAMKIQNQLESAIEWQRVDEEEPLSYDSTKDTDPESVADVFKPTAEKVGKPIATTTIDPTGKVVNREDHMKTSEFGMGGFTMPLPQQPTHIGGQWETREELKARRSNNTWKVLQTRMLYTLRKVENGVATVSFRREVLTPIEDPKVKSQIQQKLNQGVVFFDMQRGVVQKKVVQWDESVQGFEGDDSKLVYVGSYTMTLSDQPSVATKTGPAPKERAGNPLKPRANSKSGNQVGESASRSVRPKNGKPTIRK